MSSQPRRPQSGACSEGQGVVKLRIHIVKFIGSPQMRSALRVVLQHAQFAILLEPASTCSESDEMAEVRLKSLLLSAKA